jgi:hypothetical protein
MDVSCHQGSGIPDNTSRLMATYSMSFRRSLPSVGHVCVCVCVFAPYHTISITIHASQPLPFIHARHTPAPCIPASTIPGSSPISPANNHTSRGAEAENHGPHLVSSRCATSGRGCHYASNMRATSALDCTFVSSNLAGYSNPVQQATRHAAL